MDEKSRKSLEEIHDYWVSHSLPEKYKARIERSEFLTTHIEKCVGKEDNILEIGCNVGRNLNHLHKAGFTRLSGIEISEEALQELKKSFPDLAADAQLFHAPVENVIKDLADNHFDMVFTMAVLEHIHPDSEWIFAEMVRITDSYLITAEAEKTEHWRIFPRNYKDVFERLGMKQMYKTNCSKAGLGGYMLRVFEK